jgi:glyoxylase-like metal-dependent hydrolase (beta-lactamase superfamily II)
MRHQVNVTPAQRAAMLDKNPRRSGTQEVAPGLAYKRLAIVNIVMFGPPGAADRQWVLIDAGVTGTAGLIARAATARFGRESRPAAIILTHGHFDHVGGLEKLTEQWDTPYSRIQWSILTLTAQPPIRHRTPQWAAASWLRCRRCIHEGR